MPKLCFFFFFKSGLKAVSKSRNYRAKNLPNANVLAAICRSALSCHLGSTNSVRVSQPLPHFPISKAAACLGYQCSVPRCHCIIARLLEAKRANERESCRTRVSCERTRATRSGSKMLLQQKNLQAEIPCTCTVLLLEYRSCCVAFVHADGTAHLFVGSHRSHRSHRASFFFIPFVLPFFSPPSKPSPPKELSIAAGV